MAWKKLYRCSSCGYEGHIYEGRGLFQQEIKTIVCNDCHSLQNIVVGGVIADVAPSFRSCVGRLCPQCSSDNITVWNEQSCPKCGKLMQPTGEREFWT